LAEGGGEREVTKACTTRSSAAMRSDNDASSSRLLWAGSTFSRGDTVETNELWLSTCTCCPLVAGGTDVDVGEAERRGETVSFSSWSRGEGLAGRSVMTDKE